MKLIILDDGLYQLIPVTKQVMEQISLLAPVDCMDLCEILRLKLSGYADTINLHIMNDGSGSFSDQSHTVIPLDYPVRSNKAKNSKLGMSHNVKCQKFGTTVAQFYMVKEETTSERYLGVIATEKGWGGRHLTLHKVNARELSEDLKPIDDMSQIYAKHPNEFAYKIDTKDSKKGHVVSVYSFSFDRLSLKFNPLTEKYTKTLDNHGLNQRWKFDAAAIIENAESN